MTDAKINYIRLPGRVWAPLGFVRPGSVWLGPDHILTVLENGYAETYKRFYFSDIQAFIIRKSKRRFIFNAIFVIALLLIFLFANVLGGAMDTALVVTLSSGGIFILGILINSLRGPTCTVHVRTAVQFEPIGALQRIRSFEKFYARVRPLIVQAQGELDAENAREAVAYSALEEGATPPPLKSFSPRAHLAFFGVLAATCLPGFLMLLFPGLPNALFYYAIIAVAFVLGLIAVLRQHMDPCRDSALRALTWGGGVLVFVNALTHYGQMIFFEMLPENLARGSFRHSAILDVDPTESNFMFWQISVFLFLAWGVGMLGFIRAWQLRPDSGERPGSTS